MKICIVGGIFGQSSAYRALVKWSPETVLAEGLAARGHDVVVAGHSDAVKYSQFDVVHVHHLGRGALIASLDRSTTPLVFTPHNHATTAARRQALAFVLDRSDAIVDISSSLAKGRAPSIKAGVRHWIVPNGIPDSLLAARVPRPPDPDRPWKLLYVGQLIRFKRVDVLLHAFREVASRHPARLRLAYHVNHEEATLRRLAEDLRIIDQVDFLGALGKRDLADAYRSSHIVVLPSMQEYLPSVLTEAMLCGTPVVATDVGAVVEQVGRYGVIVKPESVQSLLAGIERMIAHYEHYCRLSSTMAADIRDRYSVTQMVAQHESLYSQLAGGSSRRSSMPAFASLPFQVAFSFWARKHPPRSGSAEMSRTVSS